MVRFQRTMRRLMGTGDRKAVGAEFPANTLPPRRRETDAPPGDPGRGMVSDPSATTSPLHARQLSVPAGENAATAGRHMTGEPTWKPGSQAATRPTRLLQAQASQQRAKLEDTYAHSLRSHIETTNVEALGAKENIPPQAYGAIARLTYALAMEAAALQIAQGEPKPVEKNVALARLEAVAGFSMHKIHRLSDEAATQEIDSQAQTALRRGREIAARSARQFGPEIGAARTPWQQPWYEN